MSIFKCRAERVDTACSLHMAPSLVNGFPGLHNLDVKNAFILL